MRLERISLEREVVRLSERSSRLVGRVVQELISICAYQDWWCMAYLECL